ncbi:hypothetical protein GC089_17855 [Cellulomonas sp. JZ18]|uniref:hypothetical protein n=1 Tax=Cellulomonas sp. JZ18 TaxID=2654191 RepID=UPI0012D3F40A|nr:hypothetical protein [Cellulomonas sp. JZ18]QGQ20708.1 hypothetical protein GC089_17855 [Cellulomonas sp. JZ18]
MQSLQLPEGRIRRLEVEYTPKTSFALGAVKDASARLETLLGSAPDTDAEAHVTADALFVTARGADGSSVTCLGPLAATALRVEAVPPSGEVGWFDGWNVGLKFGGMFGAPALRDTDPEIVFRLTVSPTSAKLAGIEVPTGAADHFQGVGYNIACIIKAGGYVILSAVVRNLPALATGGLDGFKNALLAELGPGSIDLIQNVIKCTSA